LHKTALGAEDAVPWEYNENPTNTAEKIKMNGIPLVLVEQTHDAKLIYELDCPFPICFMVGNEVCGVSEELSKLADIHAELPMRGVKQSLNVSVAAGVAGYEFARYYSQYKKSE
jgi:tRNA G18 (ribose-2'-O)-methylase SpoU